MSYADDGREIAIYPNPATDIVTVSVKENTEVSVVDIMGRVVKKQTVTKENNRVDISELSSGIYIFTIGSNNIQRLVKQ